ncbi:aspartic proteinase NANA, chloroplast-like [Wolffia australiana]
MALSPIPFTSARQLLSLLLLLSSSSSLAFLQSPSRAFELLISGDDSSMGNAALRLGDPPQTVLLLPDTGSSETWIFCDNFTQTQAISGHYNTAASSTFSTVHCSSPDCPNAEACSSPDELCPFTAAYADGTVVRGFWITDTVTLTSDDGQEARFKNFKLGCGSLVKDEVETVNGVLGLSPEPQSFASFVGSQLGGAAMAHYVPRDGDGGFVRFGEAGRFIATRDEMQYVALLTGGVRPASSFFVDVVGLFVGGERVPVPEWVWAMDQDKNEGGVSLDTGTALTYLAGEAYAGVVSRYVRYFRGQGSPAWEEDGGLCFAEEDYEPESFPSMAIEFKGGARLSPFPENLVYEGKEEGTACLGVKATSRSEGFIIGSYFLKGFYWEYDPERLTVGFRSGLL